MAVKRPPQLVDRLGRCQGTLVWVPNTVSESPTQHTDGAIPFIADASSQSSMWTDIASQSNIVMHIVLRKTPPALSRPSVGTVTFIRSRIIHQNTTKINARNLQALLCQHGVDCVTD